MGDAGVSVVIKFPNTARSLLPWAITVKMSGCNCQRLLCLSDNFGSGNDLVRSDTKPLPDPMSTKFYTPYGVTGEECA